MAFLLSLACLFLLPGSAWGLLRQVPALFDQPALWVPLAIGLALGLLFHHFILRHWAAFLVFEHELTHALAALLFFRRVRRFVVRSDGGYVSHDEGFGGQVGDLLITLSPYFFPTFAAPLILARPAAPPGWFPWYDGAIGAALAFHLLSNWQELGENWSSRPIRYAGGKHKGYTDIGRAGFFSSAVVIATLTLAVNGALLALLSGGYPAVWEGAKSAVATSSAVYGELARFVWGAVSPLLQRSGPAAPGGAVP
jgi:hypothetical protein